MRKTKLVRVEASILLQYEEEVDSLPTSLPTPSEVETAMAKLVIAAWKKSAKKSALDSIGAGRFNYSLYFKPAARRRANQAKSRGEKS